MKTLTLSILQFNTFVKNILDAEEFLSNISIFGEVTNFKVSGGNAYFDLKDNSAMLSCVKFGASDLNIKNGDLISVFGKVNFYVKTGRLNFVVSKTEAFGLGDLYKNFQLLKEKLEKEGLFRQEIKKPIPTHSHKIGVVTSETGAVIRDIINVTKKKNPYTDIVVYPSRVQGQGAEDELASGIEYFNTRDDIDVIIVARGGGSLEDLSPFNTEKIVRSIYDSKLPVISAVGHETDFSLCDFAADLRVPTPSVAAEVAVFDYYKEFENIKNLNKMIFASINKKSSELMENLVTISNLSTSSIKMKVVENKSKLQVILQDLFNRTKNIYVENKGKLDQLIVSINKQNPLEILRKGYAIVEIDDKKINLASKVNVGDEIKVKMTDGSFRAKVTSKEK